MSLTMAGTRGEGTRGQPATSEKTLADDPAGVSAGWQLGTAGQLTCLVFSILAATLAPGWRVGLACAVTLCLGMAFHRAGLRPLLSGRVWLFLAFLVAPAALLAGPADWNIAGLPISRQGFEAGAQMGLRALAIVVAVSGFSASVSVSALSGLMERAGLKGFGFALGVAVNMLPTIQETVTNAFQALRMRGGFRRQRWQALRLLLVTVVVNSLRHAEDVVSAAEARAFSIDRMRPRPAGWRRADVALAGGLLVVGLTIVLG
jgi:energy-coupling factor transporter transmembrane protein EcfT